MKEQNGSPDWAFQHLRGRLPKGAEMLNAVSFRRGLFQGLVLVNTTDGAALVTKGLVGKPQSAVLSFPDGALSFPCLACGARNTIAGGDTAKGVACLACGAVNRMAVVRRAARRRQAPAKAVKRRQRRKARPYRHGDYTLYARRVTSRGGSTQTFYFFAKGKPRSGTPSALPTGYEVKVGRRGGLPVLRRIRKGPAARTRKRTGPRGKGYRPQCRAITSDGKQCRNSARKGSDYCAAHKGYQPPAAGANVYHRDTRPRVGKAADTLPRVRRTRARVTVAH